jgi:hypothetical protein
MNTPIVIEQNHLKWYQFCEICEQSKTTPDTVIDEWITGLIAQVTKPQPAQPAPTKAEPLPEPAKIDTKETMDDLGDYLQELSREKTKLERENKPEELAKVKAEIKAVTKKMMEMS